MATSPTSFGDEDGDEAAAATKSRTPLAPDLQLLRGRITEAIRVLDSFAKLAEEGRSRAEYTAQLLKDICAYYGYSEYLAEKLFNLFPAREAFDFFEANESPRPVCDPHQHAEDAPPRPGPSPDQPRR